MDKVAVAGADKMNPNCKIIVGTVVKGERKGHTIGFPTINIVPMVGGTDFTERNLAFGVYACRVYTSSGIFAGALHFGPRRILDLMKPVLEVHLLDFSGDLYGQKVTVELHDKIRDTRDFDDMELLKKQIRRDVEAIRALKILERHDPVS